MSVWTQSNQNLFVAAHRGWSGRYPENTMLAFEKALELGVDQIETDVRVTRDGELVLIHDAQVDRTTNGTGAVCDYTLAALQALDAGSKKDPAFASCRIPTLRELLERVKDHPTLTLDIELKEYPTPGREALAYDVCDRTLQMLDAYGYTDRCVINSWSGRLNEYIHRTYGGRYKQHVYYPVHLLGEVTEDPYAYAYCTCVFGLLEGDVTAEQILELHRKSGVRIWAGAYAKDRESIAKSAAAGAELITCNDPDQVLTILREMGLHK